MHDVFRSRPSGGSLGLVSESVNKVEACCDSLGLTIYVCYEYEVQEAAA